MVIRSSTTDSLASADAAWIGICRAAAVVAIKARERIFIWRQCAVSRVAGKPLATKGNIFFGGGVPSPRGAVRFVAPALRGEGTPPPKPSVVAHPRTRQPSVQH